MVLDAVSCSTFDRFIIAMPRPMSTTIRKIALISAMPAERMRVLIDYCRAAFRD